MIEALGISLLAAGVVLWLLLRSTRHAAKEEIKREVAEELNESISSRAITDSDLINKLRNKANKSRKNNYKP